MEVTGRNSPCPCGSGKKFKKCCGNGAGVRQPQSAASDFNTLIQVGNALQAAGRPADAIEYFRRAIAMDPRSVVGHYNLANALRLDGQIDAAISACDQALKLQPDLAQAHCNAGNLRSER